MRLPGEVKARLLALATLIGIPAWQLLARGVDLVHDSLTPADRKLVDQLTARIRQQGASAGTQGDDN